MLKSMQEQTAKTHQLATSYARLFPAWGTTMRTIDEIRRANLKILLQDRFEGSPSQIAMRLEASQSQISQLFSGYRNIGDSIARRLEAACGLPSGWMDQDHATSAEEEEIIDIFRSIRSAEQRRKAVEMLRIFVS